MSSDDGMGIPKQQLDSQAPSIDKAHTVLCMVCREKIEPGALKCVHCDSFQDWRKFITGGNLALSLLVALVSIMAVAIPAIKQSLTPADANIHATVLGTRLDNMTYGRKGFRTFVATGQAVEFPHHDGVNLFRQRRRLAVLDGFPLKACAALLIFKPLNAFVTVALQPCFQLGALAVGLLAFLGRYADIDAGAHAKKASRNLPL